MYTPKTSQKRLALLSTVSLLVACHTAAPTVTPVQRPQQPIVLPATSVKKAVPLAPAPRVVYEPKTVPFGQIKTVGDQKIEVNVTYPDIRQRANFTTQAFDCGEVAFAEIKVTGTGISTPIYADGADAQNMTAANGCNIQGNLSNVPYGDVVVSIRLFDANRNYLSGSELLSGIVFVNNASTDIELSYRQTNVGDVLQTLQAGTIEEQFLSQQIDLAALQTFIDTVSGVNGTFPNYTFTTHPALVNIEQLITDLQTHNGDVTQLDANNSAYVQQPGSATFNLLGVLNAQPVTASIDDMLSADATVNANGPVNITNLPPGDYKLRLSGAGYIPQTVDVSITAGQPTNLGNITILSPAPTLDSVAPTSGVMGQSITLNGSNFNTTASNNTVLIGGQAATVTNATATQLTVTVPTGIAAGTNDVTVSIGAGPTSAAVTFNSVRPIITSVSPTAAVTGTDITLNGSNFNPTPGNNSVLIGGETATVVNASATQLTVTVPGGIAGSRNITVQNLQSALSDAASVEIIPQVTGLSVTSGSSTDSVIVSGSGFNASSTVKFGTVDAIVTNATATQLTVTVPASAARDVDLTVTTGNQTSATGQGTGFEILPRLTSLSAANTANGNAALIRETTLTLNGTNFDPVAANNSVTFDGANATTPLTATATQLTVRVPAAINAAGNVNVAVNTNENTSNNQMGTVPTINLNFNGEFK